MKKFFKNNWFFIAICVFSGVMAKYNEELGYYGALYIVIFGVLIGSVYFIIKMIQNKWKNFGNGFGECL